MLSFAFTKQATRRTSFTLTESAGVANRNSFGFVGNRIIDPIFSNVRTTSSSTDRTLYLDTMGDLTITIRTASSINAGADGFLVRRRSSALYGVTGYRVRVNFAYRTSRYATSGCYDFTHYEFTRASVAAISHDPTGSVLPHRTLLGTGHEGGRSAGRNSSADCGGYRSGDCRDRRKTSALEVAYRINWVPNADLRLIRTFQHASLSFAMTAASLPAWRVSDIPSRKRQR